MKVLSILLLFTPLIWELITDRDGETPKEKTLDVFVRLLLALMAAVAGWFLTGAAIIDGLILSLAIHFVAFDYLIVYILKRRGVIETKESWFNYLGNSYTDDVLRQFSPWGRFALKAGVLIGAILIYVIRT